MKIIGDVFVEFPKSSIWLLLAVENSLEQNVAQRVKKILNRAQVEQYIKMVSIIQLNFTQFYRVFMEIQ